MSGGTFLVKYLFFVSESGAAEGSGNESISRN